MLDRAASAPAATPDMAHTPQSGDRPAWGARNGGPRPAVPPPALQGPPEGGAAAADEATLTRHWAKLLLDTYSARTNFFPGGLFADPAWDMLLDLTHARLAGKRVSVSSLCIAAGVPATTALRRIGDLVASGLATRVKDENDGRRVFVELTEDGFTRMGGYLARVRVAMSASPGEPRRKI
ncbi:MAG TPA: winged helix DNA-binding protein [Parvibaculum sp.]